MVILVCVLSKVHKLVEVSFFIAMGRWEAIVQMLMLVPNSSSIDIILIKLKWIKLSNMWSLHFALANQQVVRCILLLLISSHGTGIGYLLTHATPPHDSRSSHNAWWSAGGTGDAPKIKLQNSRHWYRQPGRFLWHVCTTGRDQSAVSPDLKCFLFELVDQILLLNKNKCSLSILFVPVSSEKKC